jgi:hypothetical protein
MRRVVLGAQTLIGPYAIFVAVAIPDVTCFEQVSASAVLC